MTGLNDNFLLADDSMEPKDAPAVVINAFKEQTNEDGEPELRDDLDLIAVATEDLVVQMRDLNLLQQNIKEQGGMCQSIALEAHALLPDFISDERPIGFFTKHPSRTQLAAALEDIDANKKNIIVRMIETVVAFIKRILKKIKDFFIVSEEQKQAWKEQQEFAKNYKGPKGEKKDASDKVFHGQAAEQSKKWDEKVHLIAAMLGKDRLPIIAALMTTRSEIDLVGKFEKALKAAGDLLRDTTFDNIGTIGDELKECTKSCNDAISEVSTWDDVLQRDMLDNWVSYIRAEEAQRVVDIYDDHGPDSANRLPGLINKRLEELEKDIEDFKTRIDDESVHKLKDAQKLVSELAAFVSLMVKIQSAYSTTIKGLKK